MNKVNFQSLIDQYYYINKLATDKTADRYIQYTAGNVALGMRKALDFLFQHDLIGYHAEVGYYCFESIYERVKHLTVQQIYKLPPEVFIKK